VENYFSTTLIGQNTHEALVQKSGLRRILFDKSCVRRIYFIKSVACGAFFSQKIMFLIIQGCISFQVFCSVYQFISSENDLNSNTE